MEFSRSDTYINVYLPRPDGEDPRRYASPASPVFNSNRTYKFSDQIVKDRPLFLGRKQMSLYEIYYKDNKDGLETVIQTPDEKVEDGNETDKEEKTIEPDIEKSNTVVELPSVKKVSLSLDSKVKKSAKRRNTSRFNEPLNSYITNRKKVQTLHNFDPNTTIDRQLTTLDMLSRKREPTYSESQTKIRTLHRLVKKTQSAPADMIRTPRALGLPPIVTGNTRLSTVGVTPSSGSVSYKLTGKAMPVRPSSKPHTIWRQTTEMLTERHTPRLMSVGNYVNEPPPRIRIGVGIFN